MKTVVIAESGIFIGSLIGLGTLWYSETEKSDFHFFNDNTAWLQMDKAGHVFSSYNLGFYSMQTLEWAGAGKKKQILYGGTAGFVFLSAVEIMDGFSKDWGFSTGDVAANFTGTALLIGQEMLFDQQILRLKYSYHDNQLADYRKDALGENSLQQLFKDYNGQTYWASINLRAAFNTEAIPSWINLAFGYGATGMISSNNDVLLFNGKKYQFKRYRQYYLSFDIALDKIKTRSSFANSMLKTFSILKVPFPTLEYNEENGFNTHLLYF